MAAFSFILLFALFLPVFTFIKGCPPEFHCGRLAPIKYPFTIEGFKECGPLMLNDCDMPRGMPMIQFENETGYPIWYQVESFSPVNYLSTNLSVIDMDLQGRLNSRSCESFNNLSLPGHPHVTFKMNSSLKTMYKCDDSVESGDLDNFRFHGCGGFKIYYTVKDNASIPSPLLDCSTLQLPLNITNVDDDIFRILTSTFSLLVSLKDPMQGHKGSGSRAWKTVGKLQDGREVAVKRLYERNYHKVQQFLNEIEILTRLRHKNLVALYGCTSRRSRELLLVYEYVPNGTVADHLHGDRASSGLLTWPIRMRIAIETASALVYLHASDIIHRDVKTSNILLDNYFSVKVADFGISRLFPNDVTHISTAPQGTPGYLDPEYYQCYQLTDRSDVYSFGVVLAELLSSMPAVDIARQRHEINLAQLAMSKIQRSAFDELIDPCLGYHSDEEVKRVTTCVAELAFLCLQQNRELRPSMDEVLEKLMRIENPLDELPNLVENHDQCLSH
ncbi:LEAF RUST 10 DISEASE-RESISTANCE LOCUS RECEPTOR-LIKE PROTEIN KINASE-like 1.1 isoform X2 [Manihot esculenta]|uniref:LEAF RUST 10 DISEASE-RESISTANCE LOCUS RECEPTOR-LIKE PROTEIN KINASE-like 1.1 isoform X2 n=1 Tax=Manihot esculenta TaxID=3983 RepID=UPI001CC34686|nr:LEAF RUST 10 DISEASE-RESISTANCE LOCUS RECEPTOR-LIKE PROTEIN KINASE-like 1.1 isoform X2 [Manihot esculenta]